MKPVSALLAALVLAGCAALPPDQKAIARLEGGALHLEPGAATAGMAIPGAAWPAERWWTAYGDAQLDALMEQALQGAPGLELAQARVRAADAAVAGARAASGPNLNFDASFDRQKLPAHGFYPPPLAGTVIDDGRLALDFAYDFDWWGRNRQAVAAALSREKAEQVDLASARLMLTTALAQAYLAYQAELRRRDVMRESLALRGEIAKLAASRLARGLDPVTPQRQSQGEIEGVRYTLAQIEANLALDRNQIAALLGRGPGDLPALAPAALPAAGAGLPSDLTLDLVGRRPDIQAQRWRVEAAARDIDVARAQFYPDLNLSAFLGASSIGIARLLQAGSGIAGITPALRLPLFDGGRLRANLGVGRTALDTAIASYNQTVVEAVHQVADQASTLELLRQQQAALAGSLAAAQGVLAASRSRFQHGLSDYSSVLQAQAPVLVQADAELQLQSHRLTAQIALVKALGGGYSAEPSQAAAR